LELNLLEVLVDAVLTEDPIEDALLQREVGVVDEELPRFDAPGGVVADWAGLPSGDIGAVREDK